MFSNGKNKRTEERATRLERERMLDARLDEIGRELVRANQSSIDDIEETNSSPFLYTRLRTRITNAKEKVSFDAQNWWTMLVTAWRPLTGMALITIIAALLFWFTVMPVTTNTQIATSDRNYLVQSEPNLDRVVFNDDDSLSDDDVLTTIINQDETDVQR